MNDELDIERYEKNNLSKNFENVQERLYINQVEIHKQTNQPEFLFKNLKQFFKI